MKRTLFINEDDSHFTSGHPREDMTRKGIERLADFYCQDTQVGGVLFCVNYQKALYKSAVWEYVCDGYDPKGPDDQPFLKDVDLGTSGHGRKMFDNMLALDEQNLDRHQIWIDRCRHHGVEGWLTLRMNDCHGLQEYRQRMEEGTGAYRGWALLFPSTFWKEHPEFRRATYREERSIEGAFDYAQAEVRTHYLALVAEVLEKWDMDGIELDWMRWGMNFKPGYEAEGKTILTAFLEEVRALVRQAERRLGHAVKLGVRIPGEIEVCEALGYDPLVWADRKLVDQVVLSSFDGKANFTLPLALWRRIFGREVRIVAHCSDYLAPYTALGHKGLVGSDAINHGVAATALNRGADGLYFFNSCYFECEAPGQFKALLQTAGDEATLRRHARRHVLSFGAAAPGVPARERLPIPLVNPSIGYDYNRLQEPITIRLDTGFKPSPPAAVVLYLGFSGAVEPGAESAVRCNGQVLTRLTEVGGCAVTNNRIGWTDAQVKAAIPYVLAYRIPAECLQAGDNVFELIAFSGDAELRWAEVAVSSEEQFEAINTRGAT